MSAIKTTLFLFILMTVLAIAACQPAEGPAEQALLADPGVELRV